MPPDTGLLSRAAVRPDPTRRRLVAGAAASLWAASASAADALAAVEAAVGGRLGVAALDVATGLRLAHRADERFPMCSTFKAMAVAAVLSRVDREADRLDRLVRYDESHLLDYSPVTRPRVGEGGMPLGDLCAAAIEKSDNTAANLILGSIGGPGGWTAFVRTLGDHASRLDRTEPTLNEARPGDQRDTTTPLAMLADLRVTLLGKFLSPISRERLSGWMMACDTGRARLRAGLPNDWRIGDKTGTGDHGSTNDIAFAMTERSSILIACYLTSAESASPAERDAAHARVGRIVVDAFRSSGAGPAHG